MQHTEHVETANVDEWIVRDRMTREHRVFERNSKGKLCSYLAVVCSIRLKVIGEWRIVVNVGLDGGPNVVE